MTLGLETGPLGTDGPREFRCKRCRAHCTRSPTDGTEYGHKRGCPNRPKDLQRWVSGDPYDPDKDPQASQQQLITDGGSTASPELTGPAPRSSSVPVADGRVPQPLRS